MTEGTESQESEEREEKEPESIYDKIYQKRKTIVPITALALVLIVTALSIYPAAPSECASGTCNSKLNTSNNIEDGKVNEGDTVMLAYEIQSENGSTVGNNTGEYKLGQGKLPQKVKKAVTGMNENETTDVEIDIPSEITKTTYKDKLKQALGVNSTLESGQTYTQSNGETITIEKVSEKAVQISMPNPHPLAGETAVFKITVKNIKTIEKKETPKVELFIMSQCPYGNQAEETMEPVYELLGDEVDWNIHYIVSEENGTITSLHGEKEVEQNKKEICVLENHGTGKWFDFVTKLNNGKDWETAAGELGLETQGIQSCVEEKGYELLKEEAKITSEKGRIGSPTLYINGMKSDTVYQYGKPNAYKEEICKGFKTKPEECGQEIQSQSTGSTGSGSCG